MSLYSSLPRDYDSQFQAPEPEGMLGVSGSDPNRYEVDPVEYVAHPQTEANRVWRKSLADACKKEDCR